MPQITEQCNTGCMSEAAGKSKEYFQQTICFALHLLCACPIEGEGSGMF